MDREILDQNQEIKDAYEAGDSYDGMTALESFPVVGPLAAMGVDYARGNYNEGGLVANPNVNLPFEMIGGGGGLNALTGQAKTKTFATYIGDGIQEFSASHQNV